MSREIKDRPSPTIETDLEEQTMSATPTRKQQNPSALSALRTSATLAATLLAALAALIFASTAGAQQFGLSDFSGELLDSGGNPALQAGGHPAAMRTNMVFNTQPNQNGGESAVGDPKDVIVDLPPGFIVDPSKVPNCPTSSFMPAVGSLTARCAHETQIGEAVLLPGGSQGGEQLAAPIYNLEPNRNEPASIGFNILGTAVRAQVSVRPGDYGIRTAFKNTPQQFGGFREIQVILWGNPADPSHDVSRGRFCIIYPFVCLYPNGGTPGVGNPSASPQVPLITNATNCSAGPLTTRLQANAWHDPEGSWVTESFDHDVSANPMAVTGCEDVPFRPNLDLEVAESRADTPTAIDARLTMPASSTDPESIGHGHLNRAVVELPEGMSVNPASADGLEACSTAQIALQSNESPNCPQASKIGTVQIKTPLLADPLEGSIYLAAQNDNPFNSLLAIYLVAEGQGVVLKIPGEVKADQDTGELSVIFDDSPQFPFSELEMHFKGGARAPLATPPSCGTYEIEAALSPWSAQDPDNPTESEIVSDTSSFTIDQGPSGSPCADSPQDRPFEPQMSSGVTSPTSATYSPFVFRLTRTDGDQEILSTTVTPPQGVTAKLAGIPLCTDQQASAGNCPAESRIGKVVVGAGAGSSPFYIQSPNEGKVYLTDAYKGAQLGMLIQVPAVAGPLDLGTVNVRAAIQVDPRTAQLTVASDPIPQILEGIPLRVKDMRIIMDRESFTLAGTNCDPMQVGATVQGSHGATANLTNHFQVGDCGSLGFSPKLKLDFGNKKSDTKRNQHPPLSAKLSFNEGDANISSVQVALPEGVLLDQERIGKVCSREAYAASSCPAESQVGYAKATTPLLDQPVEGPVYLKASDNVLPDLAADLNGQIDIDLFGRIDQREGKKVSRIQNTFDVVPDVPVSDFELTLAGGKDGLLVNSKSICSSKRGQRVSIDMVAHNEMSTSSNPLIGSACKSINKKKAKKLKKKAAKLLRKAKKADSKKKAKKLRKQARKLKKQARKLGR